MRREKSIWPVETWASAKKHFVVLFPQLPVNGFRHSMGWRSLETGNQRRMEWRKMAYLNIGVKINSDLLEWGGGEVRKEWLVHCIPPATAGQLNQSDSFLGLRRASISWRKCDLLMQTHTSARIVVITTLYGATQRDGEGQWREGSRDFTPRFRDAMIRHLGGSETMKDIVANVTDPISASLNDRLDRSNNQSSPPSHCVDLPVLSWRELWQVNVNDCLSGDDSIKPAIKASTFLLRILMRKKCNLKKKDFETNCYELLIHLFNTSNIVWRKKSLAGGFFYHFPADGEFFHLTSY